MIRGPAYIGWSGVDDETHELTVTDRVLPIISPTNKEACRTERPSSRRLCKDSPFTVVLRLSWWKRKRDDSIFRVVRASLKLASPCRCLAVVDTRGKGPLLNLENPASVWPPPRSGRDGTPSSELEAPLLTPSKFPADLEYAADDCLLDDINTQVGRF